MRNKTQIGANWDTRSHVDPRETMRALPGAVQPFLTALTGKPLANQKATRHTPGYHFITALATLLAGWLLCVLCLRCRPLAAVPLWFLGCLLFVSGARKLQLMIVHQCAHGTFSSNRRINSFIGTVISTFLLIEPFARYRRAHLYDHHSKNHMTESDPTVRFLIDFVGLRPSMTVERLWLTTLRRSCSPLLHLKLTAFRARSQFTSTFSQGVLSGLWLLALLLITYETSIETMMVTWWIPLTVPYHISSCLRLCSEHRWPTTIPSSPKDRNWYASLSTGIFVGEPFPSGATARQFAWALRMLTIHVFTRVFVLVGDTPCHDFHHRHPMSREWPNYAFAREADRLAEPPLWPEYTEIWGLGPAISASFKSLSTTTVLGGEHGNLD